MNCINERSFVCLDKTFFHEGFALSDKKPKFSPLSMEESKGRPGLSMISKKPGKRVEDDDLGFCNSEEEEEENDEYVDPVQQQEADEIHEALNIENNKYIKEDIAMLNSLCSDIVGSQLVMQIKKNKQRPSLSPNKGAANKFIKSQESPRPSQDEQAFTKFKASVKDSGLIEDQDPNCNSNKKGVTGKLTELFVENNSPQKVVKPPVNNKRNSDQPTAANTNAKKRKID